LSPVIADLDTPVAGTVTVTLAPRTAAPVGSVTVPEMLPVVCAWRKPQQINSGKQTTTARRKSPMQLDDELELATPALSARFPIK
jgi:hypothetical protein